MYIYISQEQSVYAVLDSPCLLQRTKQEWESQICQTLLVQARKKAATTLQVNIELKPCKI